jgi:hypothetical protein
VAWTTAQDIRERFIVSEVQLASFGRRGNLPFRREPDGEVLYDDRAVALLFRGRGEAATDSAIATLGASRLGPRAPAPFVGGAREERKRALRRGTAGGEAPRIRRLAG